MIIVPVNVADVAEAVAQMLREWPALAGVPVTVGEEVNEQPERCPWVGVYRFGIKYPVRTLGVHDGFRRQIIELGIITQQQSTQSGQDCCRAIEDLNQQVIGCLLNDSSLRGHVHTLDEFEARYPDYQAIGGRYFQSSLIYFSGVTNVGAQ